MPLSTYADLWDAGPSDEILERVWAGKEDAPGLAMLLTRRLSVFALDVDSTDAEAWAFDLLAGVTAPVIISQRGRKWLFTMDGVEVRSSAGVLREHVDVKGFRSILVLPPTPGYSWAAAASLDDRPAPPAPQRLMRLITASQRPQRDVSDGPVPEGRRHDVLVSLAGSMRRRGMDTEAILAALRVENVKRCSPPVGDEEVHSIATSATWEPAAPLNTERAIADQLRRDERSAGSVLDDLASAADEDRLFTILATAQPPASKLARQQVRGRLVPILKEKFSVFESGSSPSKTADAWLTSSAVDDGSLQGSVFAPEETPPWEQSVGGEEVVGDVADAIGRFVYLSGEALDAAALWTIFTHAHDAFGVSPILQLSSATMRCGKTSLMLPIYRMANKGLLASNISPAALFRSVEAWRPTLCIDEADTFLKMSDELRGLLNAGHTRDTAFTLRAEGDANQPRLFSTWAPKVVAAIGRLPGTISDRSIVLVLRRKPTSARKDDAFDSDGLRDVCQPVRQRVARWVLDNADALAATLPERPEGLSDRAWNNWRPLLTIATVVGGEWPQRARTAAIVLSGGEPEDDAATLALRHIKAVFADAAEVATSTVLGEFIKRDDAPWAKWWEQDLEAGRKKGPSMRLAKILREFGIEPCQVWIDGRNQRGYRREPFLEHWATYAPGDWRAYALTESGSEPRTLLPEDDRDARDAREQLTGGAADQDPSDPSDPSDL
ncbi:MAG: DUF3631 domain-containing protein, partial [Actinomycetota bacterium]